MSSIKMLELTSPGTCIALASRARAWLNAPQNVNSGVATKVNFDTEEFDSRGDFDAANSRFSCFLPGTYIVLTAIRFAAMGLGVTAACRIRVNGALARGAAFETTVNSVASAAMTSLVNLAQGDFVEVYAFQNSGGAVALSNVQSATYMCVAGPV